jgi:hypothetical protein
MLPATSIAVGSMEVAFFPGIFISKTSPAPGSGTTLDALGRCDQNRFRVGFAPSSEPDCAAKRCSRLAASRASATLISLMAGSNSSEPPARALSSPIFRRIVLINRNCRFGGPKPIWRRESDLLSETVYLGATVLGAAGRIRPLHRPRQQYMTAPGGEHAGSRFGGAAAGVSHLGGLNSRT